MGTTMTTIMRTTFRTTTKTTATTKFVTGTTTKKCIARARAGDWGRIEGGGLRRGG